ncbi:MAG: excinuclease ABC subunit UvrB [Spirochaetia bacterium]|nr:excinuclease ABC subunit UvrB [Spirochaetia bacterium]
MKPFRLHSEYQPSGDQPHAIEELVSGIRNGEKQQTLMGVTGSGKTFTMAKVIEAVQMPTLIISHNKTLAAQLYREFKSFFPENAVEYFVSYYDYYQPEAYVPSKDLYIEKDASINDEIERLRLSATSSLLERKDVIIVATVSCIYGIGNPDNFREMRISVTIGKLLDLRELSLHLISLQYERNDAILERGKFRIRGDVFEIQPAYEKFAYRIELDWDTVVSIKKFDPVTGDVIEKPEFLVIYPAKHFVMPEEKMREKLGEIEEELRVREAELLAENRILEAQRLRTRVELDIEMMKELGYCSGIENYSRILDGRKPGDRPAVLIDYFPKEFLTIIDESHVTVPQIGGMYEGDRSRKQNLVHFGFRLPCALDNRPLVFDEFRSLLDTVLYVSATPGKWEKSQCSHMTEQIIRPTGLLDPDIEIRPTEGQIEDLYKEIQARIAVNERSLVTTLTKKMAEDLTDYFLARSLKVRYMHSEVETIERVEIIKQLRTGEIDVLIGINLLREGLDMPEVSLVAILDADKIGFLRSATSLIQTIGRAARNANGRVIMYADRESDAMKEAIGETVRRRSLQQTYNAEHGIVPRTVIKKVDDILIRTKKEEKSYTGESPAWDVAEKYNLFRPSDKRHYIRELEEQMLACAAAYDFEQAAVIRDRIYELQGKKKRDIKRPNRQAW